MPESEPGMQDNDSPQVTMQERNAMMVGMAVLRGEIDLATLDPKVAEMVVAVLDKYHPEWRKMMSRSAPPPGGPGMPMGRPGMPPGGPGAPMNGRPSASPMRPAQMRPGLAQGRFGSGSPSGAPPMGMK